MKYFENLKLPSVCYFLFVFSVSLMTGCVQRRVVLPQDAERPVQAYKYTAYISSANNSYAIINDRMYKVGESVEGENLRIVEINRFRVMVEDESSKKKTSILHVDQGL